MRTDRHIFSTETNGFLEYQVAAETETETTCFPQKGLLWCTYFITEVTLYMAH